MATTAKKPKQKTRDQLIKEVASLETEVRLLKDQLAELRNQREYLSTCTQSFRGIIAELEREKAMLQGYIERDLQDKRDAALYREGNNKPSAQDSNLTQHVGEITPYSMPALINGPAGIDEQKGGSIYGDTYRKPWYKI